MRFSMPAFVVIAGVILFACDKEKSEDGTSTPSVRDSMNVVLEAQSTCAAQGNAIVINATVTRLGSSSPGQQIPVHVMVRIYWWISCSQAGLSEWFLEKTATAVTGTNGRCQIAFDFGVSEFPGATFQHIDEIKLTN